MIPFNYTHYRNLVAFVTSSACLMLVAGPAAATQFSFLDPAYTQEIYAGPGPYVPGAWTGTNQLIARDASNSNILEFSSTQNTVHLGTNLHGITATHTVTGLATGANITKATNGMLYLPTQVGLQRVDPTTWGPAVTVTPFGGPGYGVNALPNGNVVYDAGGGSTDIHIYNPTTTVDTLVYTAPGLIDDIETSTTGLIALAGQSNNDITLLNSSGGFIQSFPTTQYPDGLAFATMATPPAMYSSDNKGTVTRYDFGLGYASPPTAVVTIASGGSYGDIATPGPDCAFYLIQAYTGGAHGSALFGTHWDDNTINNESSIIRIALKQGCMVDHPVGTPEPGALTLMLLGCASLALVRRIRGK
jgi:hypothetical protein